MLSVFLLRSRLFKGASIWTCTNWNTLNLSSLLTVLSLLFHSSRCSVKLLFEDQYCLWIPPVSLLRFMIMSSLGRKGKKKGKTLKLPNSKTFNHECSVRILKENNRKSHSLKSCIQLSGGLCTVKTNASLSSLIVLSLTFSSILLSETIDMLFLNGNLS